MTALPETAIDHPTPRAVHEITEQRSERLRHDIRHEIATIGLLTSAAARSAEAGENISSLVRLVVNEVHWLVRLVQLELTDPVGPDGEPKPMRLDRLVGETISTLRSAMVHTRFECTLEETWARVDAFAFHRAIRNVVDNAVRAAGSGGIVRLRVTERDGRAIVEVDDDGPGIGAGPRGIGSLGLGIVREVADRYHGILGMRRSPMGGASVLLSLPSVTVKRSGGGQPATPDAGTRRSSLRLLICDDHPVFADALALLLGQHGYEVAAATYSIEEARSVLMCEEVDVCLLDLALGDGSGLQCVTELRELSPDTHYVLLSAHLDADVASAAIAAGFEVCVPKVRGVDEIQRVLERVRLGKPATDGGAAVRVLAERRAADDAQRLADQLTPRERDVLARLARGDGTAALARDLGVSRNTARTHIQSVLTKLGVHSRLEAVAFAVRHDLISP